MAETMETILLEMQRFLLESNDIALSLTALPATRWADTGLESLALMELVLHLEQHYHTTISNETLRDVQTFGELARLFWPAVTIKGAAPC